MKDANSYRANQIGLLISAIFLIAVGCGIENSFFLTTLIFTLISAISAIGLTLLFGFTGLASLGQAAFWGIGAYTAALLADRAHVPPLVALAAGVVVAGILGWVISRPLLRLTGTYLAMASLAFGVVMYLAFSQFSALTGGLDPGFVLLTDFHIGGWNLSDTKSMYFVCSVATIVTLWVGTNILHSRFGRGLRALKTSEPATEGVAVPTVAYKTAVFAIAAGMAGLSGGLYAFFMRSFNSTAFGFPQSIELLVMVIIGSTRSLWGAVFGAFVVTVLPAMLENFNDYKLFIYGVATVVIMMFLPDGLFHGFTQALSRLLRRKVVS
jgi:branched-chain amino acid transport system permease protein